MGTGHLGAFDPFDPIGISKSVFENQPCLGENPELELFSLLSLLLI